MKGAEMMLKAMGLDPAELQSKFGEVVTGLQAKFVALEMQQTRIEIAQLHILHNMRVLAEALKIEGMQYGEENGNGPQFGLDFHGDNAVNGSGNGNN